MTKPGPKVPGWIDITSTILYQRVPEVVSGVEESAEVAA